MTRFLTMPILYALLAVALTLGAAATWQTLALANERSAHQTTRAKHADTLRGLAELTAQAQRDVRAREQQYAANSAASRDQFDQEKKDALNRKDAVIAGLRDDSLQLRPWWDCAVSSPANGATGAPVFGDDGAADLRAAGAGDLVQGAAGADTWIRWLQRELISTRQACGVLP